MHVGKLAPSSSKPLIGSQASWQPLRQKPRGEAKQRLTVLRAESEEEKAQPSGDDTWKVPLAGSDTDWRAFRARLVAGESAEPAKAAKASDEGQHWAHAISQPERGCLVLAHPLMFKSHQQYFDQAVILLINHDESGTAGLIMNKPMQQYIGSLSGAEGLRPEFDKNPIFLGGDVGGVEGENVLQLLHNQKQLAKSTEIVDGVYIGGYEAARMAVRREELDPVSTCRWYCRYAGWAPGQLQSEITQGVWFPVAANKDLILHESALKDGHQHWHTVMQTVGGEYKQLSDALQVDPNVNYLQQMADAEKKQEEDKRDSEET